jgi:hypothetical protein
MDAKGKYYRRRSICRKEAKVLQDCRAKEDKLAFASVKG